MSALGEKIFQHYELFLGSHIGADRYTNNEYGTHGFRQRYIDRRNRRNSQWVFAKA